MRRWSGSYLWQPNRELAVQLRRGMRYRIGPADELHGVSVPVEYLGAVAGAHFFRDHAANVVVNYADDDLERRGIEPI